MFKKPILQMAQIKQIQWFVFALLLIASAWVVGQSSWADDHVLTRFSSTPISMGELSEQAAVDKARAEFDGAVLSVKSQTLNDQPVFRIQILSSSGRIKVLNIHRVSGEVVR